MIPAGYLCGPAPMLSLTLALACFYKWSQYTMTWTLLMKTGMNLVIEGLVHATTKKLQLDWTKPQKTELSVAVRVFWDRKLLQTELDWTSSSQFKLLHDTPCKYSQFPPILKGNGSELHILWPKQCFSKIWLCATSHSCIFWVLDNFYCHKNFMGSYYTLYILYF